MKVDCILPLSDSDNMAAGVEINDEIKKEHKNHDPP